MWWPGTDTGNPEGGDDVHPELAQWAANVGPALALDFARPLATPVAGLTVLSWNLAIGTARLHSLLRRLREGAFGAVLTGEGGTSPPVPDWPLVILAQEAFRGGDAVPLQCVGRCHGGRLRARRRADIGELAAAEGLSLRYVPSMRNGTDRSDRGNAILSSVPIADAGAFGLPYVRQRRVAVAVTLAGVPRLLLASAHLDTGGRARRPEDHVGGFGGGRAAQAAALGNRLVRAAGNRRSLVLGADLNSALGVRDPALLALVRAGLHIASRRGNWWHTYHGAIPLLLDHVLFRSAGPHIASVSVTRLDEAPGDRSRRVFGSDHHPLLARVTFGEPPSREQVST